MYWLSYLGLQLWIFSGFRLDYFDAFEYLRGARTLAGPNIGYWFVKPPTVSLLHAPVEKLLDLLNVATETRLSADHLFQCLLSALCLIAVFHYLKLYFSSGWAHLGTILFSLNRVTIHYFGMVLSDIPCLLFFLLFLYEIEAQGAELSQATFFYPSPPRRRGSIIRKYGFIWIPAFAGMTRWGSSVGNAQKQMKWRIVLGGAALGLALLSRWNMPALLFAVLGYQALQSRKTLPKWLEAAAFAGAIVFCVGAMVYQRALGVPLLQFPRFLAWLYNFQIQDMRIARQVPWWTYAKSLCVSAGIFSLPFFAWGVIASVKKQNRNFLFHAFLFAFFFCVMSFGLGPKESRYLFPVLPFFYSVALLGIQTAWTECRRSLSNSALIALAALSLSPAAYAAVLEWSHAQDPIYRDPILFDTIRAVGQNRRPGGRVFWTGAAYSMVPSDPVFFKEDYDFYVYHIPSPGSVAYLLGTDVPQMNERLIKTVREGDIMIRSPVHLFVLGEPWNPAENKLEIVQRHGNNWKRIALLPK